MSSRSFRGRYRRLVPTPGRGKPAFLLAVGILAGCGGGGDGKSQRIQAAAYSFAAPATWVVTRSGETTAASLGSVDRVEVRTFSLVKPYSPDLLAAASRELDGVAAKLAEQLRGRVATRATTRVDGRDARAYTIDSAGRAHEITFVLDGSHEYELLCRRPAASKGAACRQLVRSFRLD
jgi:hypothetical protein